MLRRHCALAADRGGSGLVNPRVFLVSAPFGPLSAPSIALGLLSAYLRDSGIPSRSLYLTIPFAEQIGADLYDDLASGRPATTDLVGEWVFSSAAFPDDAPGLDEYREVVLARFHAGTEFPHDDHDFTDTEWAGIEAARERAPRFLDVWAERLAEQQPAVVGFTSVFQQQLASLALARRVKQLVPDALTVFGGANNEGVMGAQVLESFDYVDA